MRRLLFPSILLAGLSAVRVVAQTTASPGVPAHEPGVRAQTMHERMAAEEAAMLGMRDLRIAAELNLTADQQTKIRNAFDEASEFRRGIAGQNRELRDQLVAAVKAGDLAMIDQISEAFGMILQQQIAFQAKTVAKVYAILTPEQKSKLDEEVRISLGALDHQERRRGL